jgi:drug/metabolite transporter (DMT)-like permease
MNVFVALFMTVIGNVIYHICQKNIPSNVSPFYAVGMMYGVGVLFCVLAIVVLPTTNSGFKYFNWSIFGVGISALIIELGFLLAYRAGARLNTSALWVTSLVTIFLVPLGMIFFRESISVKQVCGIFLALIGLSLMK